VVVVVNARIGSQPKNEKCPVRVHRTAKLQLLQECPTMSITSGNVGSIVPYCSYLLQKFYIIGKDVELHSTNCIDDIDKFLLEVEKIQNKFNQTEHVSGNWNLQKLTEEILEYFQCFNVIDFELESRIATTEADQIYEQFKKYKQNNSTVEQQASEEICCGKMYQCSFKKVVFKEYITVSR
jgi:hypothetical protein